MPIDPSSFHQNNVADTCAVWNVLSSRTLFSAATEAQVVLVCTEAVVYECLHKPRGTTRSADAELKKRLVRARTQGAFAAYPLELTDLQTVALLQARKRVGMGEFSSIAFAERVGQAFLTDDQKARRLAEVVLPRERIQTTPHLLGWLFFAGRLSDADKKSVLEEHAELDRPLSRYFEEMYQEGCRCRLAAQVGRRA